MLRAVGAILRKDLLLELRTRESVPAMAIFGVTTLVVFHFALDQPTLEGDLAAGVLWVSFLFAAMLGLNRLFVAEEEQGGFDGFLLAPIDRTSLYVAKALALLTYLVIVELVAVPAFAILLLEPALWPALPGPRPRAAARRPGDLRRRRARVRDRHPDPRARPHRPAARAAAAHPRRHRRGGGDGAAARRRAARSRCPGAG